MISIEDNDGSDKLTAWRNTADLRQEEAHGFDGEDTDFEDRTVDSEATPVSAAAPAAEGPAAAAVGVTPSGRRGI